MCNGLIYMITPTPVEVLSGGTLPLSTIARRRSTGVNVENNTIVLSVPGYYKVNAQITLSATAPGDVKISAYKNGVAIPGITATETITTATTEVRTLSLSGIVRVFCNDGVATISLVNESDVAITTSNISLSVEYLD